MASNLSKSVVFITGTFIGNNCRDEWVSYFEKESYKSIAPGWPYKDADAEVLRNRAAKDPIALIRLTSLIDHFSIIINALPEKPILIGHSLGRLIVRLLIQKNLGAAGVVDHSFPPQGVNRFWLSFLKAIWKAIMLFSSGKQTYLMPFDKWKYLLANGRDYEQQKKSYYLYATSESKMVIAEAFNGITRIDFNKPHVPLMLTSGGNDKLIPASLCHSNYKKYTMTNSFTDYIEFNAHNHLVFGALSWKSEADVVLHWLLGLEKNNH